MWLPGGGYHADSWKVFAGSVLVLGGRGHQSIQERFDPLSVRFQRISRLLSPKPDEPLGWELLTEEESGELRSFGRPVHRPCDLQLPAAGPERAVLQRVGGQLV